MAKLVDLKLSKTEKKEGSPQVAFEAPNYSYGTCLRLGYAELEKLGIENLPKVGATFDIRAVGVVTSVSSHESANRDDRNVEIQIQKLALEDESDDSLDYIVRKKAR